MFFLNTKRVTVFTGHYGSGKTEIAVNFALQCKQDFPNITLIDLDFVNPYFRSREARELLENSGIDVVASNEEYFDTDVPAFSRRTGGVLKDPGSRSVVDLGGDETGARAIGRFRHFLSEDELEFYFVVNPFRPFTSKPLEIKSVVNQVEKASGLKVSSLVSNPNLIKETTLQHILDGQRIVTETAGLLGLPVAFTVVEQKLIGLIDEHSVGTPILPINRRMLVPWEQSVE